MELTTLAAHEQANVAGGCQHQKSWFGDVGHQTIRLREGNEGGVVDCGCADICAAGAFVEVGGQGATKSNKILFMPALR
jgi:hypothetical protein